VTKLSIGIRASAMFFGLDYLIASIPWLVMILILIVHLCLWVLIIFGGTKKMKLYIKHKGVDIWEIIKKGPIRIEKSKDWFTMMITS